MDLELRKLLRAAQNNNDPTVEADYLNKLRNSGYITSQQLKMAIFLNHEASALLEEPFAPEFPTFNTIINDPYDDPGDMSWAITNTFFDMPADLSILLSILCFQFMGKHINTFCPAVQIETLEFLEENYIYSINIWALLRTDKDNYQKVKFKLLEIDTDLEDWAGADIDPCLYAFHHIMYNINRLLHTTQNSILVRIKTSEILRFTIMECRNNNLVIELNNFLRPRLISFVLGYSSIEELV